MISPWTRDVYRLLKHRPEPSTDPQRLEEGTAQGGEAPTRSLGTRPGNRAGCLVLEAFLVDGEPGTGVHGNFPMVVLATITGAPEVTSMGQRVGGTSFGNQPSLILPTRRGSFDSR
jgi:hypothetical protein